MRGGIFKGLLLSGVSLAVALPALAQETGALVQAPVEADYTSEDVVVTARRRDERLQDVPVSVSAFSAAALERSNVQQVSDLRTITPGFTVAPEGGKDTMSLTMRGIGQLPLGEGTPGVVTYTNNVPMPSVGSNLPTYDLAGVEVLKGPQGTLFGRNTLGGAVLISTARPTYDFGGYVQGTIGRFDYREVQGAVNIPLAEDQIALRVAGQLRQQDPRTEAFDGGPGFDDLDQQSWRVSLLLEPTSNIRSLTVYDHSEADDLAGGLYLLRQNFPMAAVFGPGFAPTDAQIAAYLATQQGSRDGAFDDGINGGRALREADLLMNDTSIEVGSFTFRNIIGYRENFSDQLINTGAVGPLTIDGGPFGLLPFTLFHAAAVSDRKYFTEEFQFLGDFERFNFILGAFYNKDEPNGLSGSQFTAFSVGGVPAAPVTAHVENENYALFGQLGVNLTDQLTLNAGLRYSWDEVSACGGAAGSTYIDYSTCRGIAATGAVDGVGVVENSGQEPSWTLGLDYKPSADWLLYMVTRRGYRGAAVNTPAFESIYTTGGADASCVFGGGICPDLRPFQTTQEETITDYEIGSKWSFRDGDRSGRFNVSAFYSQYRNALQFLNVTGVVPQAAPDTPTNTAFGANLSDQNIFGLEFDLSYSPNRDFTISFNGAATQVDIENVNLPASLPAGIVFNEDSINKYSPKFSGTLAVSWTLPIRPADSDLVFDADYFHTADFGGQNGEKLPGYNLANARLSLNGVGGGELDLALFVRNVFDEEYYAAASVLLSTFPVSSVYGGEPRVWGLQAGYRF